MKELFKNKKAYALLLSLLLLPWPAGAFAAASASASVDKQSVRSGDTVEVTITVKGKGLTVAEGFFTYDPAVLTYAESRGGASDGFLDMVSAAKGGSDVLTASVRFTAASAGSAKVEFSVEKTLGYDGSEQGGAKADVSVSVSAPEPTPAPAPLSYAASGVLARNVKEAPEEMYIWRSLENVTIPSRYSETTLEYHGETVAAAKVTDSDAPTLLYLSNDAGGNGGYYIFEASKDALYPYRTVSSVSKSYILLEPDGSVALPEGFEQTTLTIGEREYAAWKARDAQGEIYLLYARNPDGEVGYYAYNAEDESLQRYAVMPARPVQPSLSGGTQAGDAPEQTIVLPASSQEGEIVISSVVFYAMCGVGLLLLAVIAALLAARVAEKKRRRHGAGRGFNKDTKR